MFDIAVILINYNSTEHTINCVNSIIEKTSQNISYQIIITDNCSEKDEYLKLKSYCDSLQNGTIKLYRNTINAGFGGGNMYGLQFANANYYAFVNNDTLFKNDCLSILKTTLDTNQNIGIAGAQAFKENGDFMISLDHFASPIREILGRNFFRNNKSKKIPETKKNISKSFTS